MNHKIRKRIEHEGKLCQIESEHCHARYVRAMSKSYTQTARFWQGRARVYADDAARVLNYLLYPEIGSY